MDDGAGRYFGTLYGVLTLLRSKGLADPEDMNDLAGYADLASKAIMKVVNLSREIAMAAGVVPPDLPPMGYWTEVSFKPKPSPERLKVMHKELLEAVADLETMAGPMAIVDKIQDEVSDHMADMDLKAMEKRKSRFKVLNGGGEDHGPSDTRVGDHPRPVEKGGSEGDDGSAA